MNKSKLKIIGELCIVIALVAFAGRMKIGANKCDAVKEQTQIADVSKEFELGIKPISLNGEWKLSFAEQPAKAARTPKDFKNLRDVKTIDAKVPGNVEIDLLNAKLIPDPMIGDNVFKLRKFESYQWLYTKKFATPKLENGQRAVLNFNGIDTLADIFVNGHLVGSPENMFIQHKFDVTDFLKSDGENTLEIILRSVVAEAQKDAPIFNGAQAPRYEMLRTRKAPASFGWDIHPRIVTVGLWRDVSLDVENPVHIKDVNFYTRKVSPEAKKATAVASVFIATPFGKIDDLRIRITVKKDGKFQLAREIPAFTYESKFPFDIDNVELWWPRGYGTPALYDLTTEVLDKSGKIIARKNQKIGFRTIKLEFKELELPEGDYQNYGNGNVSGTNLKGKPNGEFKFIVNETPIFVKGTNWVPLDASHSRDLQHVKPAMDMIADLNCNMVRCWGGNVYESDRFYELCDQYGVMVWQDFSMGCSVYPQDSEFAKKIEEEVAAIVVRLRKHPCIALWAGNNENDQAYGWGERDFKMSPANDRISREVIPYVIKDFDWTRAYIPSSPYLSKITFDKPEKFAPPEVHLWGPRGYYKDAFYKDAIAPFVSEIGYHGCPNRESLEKMMQKDFVYPWTKDGKWNKQWQAKAVMSYPNTWDSADRNDLMTKQVKIIFGEVPQDLDTFIFASQAVQAEAKKYFIEMWRTQKFTPKTGILWWNLRDAWPILSDAIVDYYNSKKLAYHYIKRVQSNVCAMIDDNLELIAANDTLKTAKIKASVKDIDSGKILLAQSSEIPANGKVALGKLDVKNGQGMLLIEYSVDGGETVKNHYLYGKPPFKLADYKKWYQSLDIKR